MSELLARIGACLTVGVIVSTAAATRAQAGDLPGNAEEIAAHLEFLGYDIETTDDALVARHAQKRDIRITAWNGGTLLTGYFKSTDYAKQHREEFLEFANAFNVQTSLVVFYLDPDDDLGVSAWFTGGYEKVSFGRFIERWEADLNDAIQRDFDQTKRFLD